MAGKRATARMSVIVRLLRHIVHQTASAVLSFVLWVLWILLALLAMLLIAIATNHQLRVPGFVLRQLESRLETAGMRATFERAAFDPTGRILIESPRVFLAGYSDPVASARAAYVGLSPWPALVGRFEIRELRLVDGTLFVPAMLSPSGKADPVVRDIDALVIPGGRETTLREVSARVGGLLVSVHGSFAAVHGASHVRPEELAVLIRSRFVEACRLAAELSGRLDALEQPSLDVTLEPSPTCGAIVTVDLMAAGLKLDAPVVAQLGRFRATTHFPLLGETAAASRLDLSAELLRLPGLVEVHQLTAALRGRVKPAERRVDPGEIEFSAEAVSVPDGSATWLSGVINPHNLQRWDAAVVGRFLDSPLGLKGEVNLEAQTIQVRFAGQISPQVMLAINRRAKIDVRKYFDFDALDCARADLTFGPAWKFARLTAQVALRGIHAYGVTMDDGTATVEVDPQRFYSPEAYARIGSNYAHGTYEHIFATHEYRFLLNGQLRPLDIGEWFHDWWINFFHRFDFPTAAPVASVDVHGFWRDGRQTYVFVFADTAKPIVLGQPLDRVRTRIFIRPGFYDGLELFGVDRAGHIASGTFCVANDVESSRLHHLDVEGTSTIPLDLAAAMIGDAADSVLSPFVLARAPELKFRGHFEGPEVVGPKHRQLDLEAKTTGAFRFFRLPFEDVGFTAALRDEELSVEVKEAKFAGGALRGHARLWGADAQRRIALDATLTDASLGTAAAVLQNFVAERKGLPPPPPGKFVQEKANVRADITGAVEGLVEDSLSFHGAGNASLRGAEIGEVSLFGPLSDLLKFTALRFTTAHTSIKVNGTKLEFPDVALRGANSAIDAHGEYALDRRQLDFRAKVYPFQASDSVLKSVVGVVLTPLSSALEVKLTGTFDKPEWAFVMGPTNLLRALGGESEAAGVSGAAAPTPSGAVSAEGKSADKPTSAPMTTPSAPVAPAATKP